MIDAVDKIRHAARAVEALVATHAVGVMWAEPSVLPGYRVGGLAAHLVRGMETIRTYVGADTLIPAGVETVDAPGYYARVLARHDPLTSEFHAAVRDRGEQRVDEGHAALVAAAADAAAWLLATDLDTDRVIAVLDGVTIRVDDYLATRLVELAIHSDDLARSVGIEPPPFDEEIWTAVAELLAELTLRRHPHRLVALALARPDRMDPVGAFTRVPT